MHEIPCAHRIIISGTPLQNHLKVCILLPFLCQLKLYNQVKFCVCFSCIPITTPYPQTGVMGAIQLLLPWAAGRQTMVYQHAQIQSAYIKILGLNNISYFFLKVQREI